MSRPAYMPTLLESRENAFSGLDAIVIHTAPVRTWWERLLCLKPQRDSRFLAPPSVSKRLVRYYDAALLWPLHRDPYKARLREELGALFLDGWKRGKRPQLRLIQQQMPALKQRRHLRSVS